jgi:hypothetical protein
MTVAEESTALAVLGLPDVSGLPIPEDMSPEDCATLIMAIREQLANANRNYAEMCAPIYELLKAAGARVEGAIIDAGGSMLPHDTFDVVLDQRTQREKRIDILRQLAGKLPDDLFAQSVYVHSIEGKIAPEVAKAAVDSGATLLWGADLRKLDTYARKFGGEIAEIIERGSPRVEVGAPVLKITPRESALKVVS